MCPISVKLDRQASDKSFHQFTSDLAATAAQTSQSRTGYGKTGRAPSRSFVAAERAVANEAGPP